MTEADLIRDLTAEEGWDCALAILEDCRGLLPKTRSGIAVRRLIDVEHRRRKAFKASTAWLPT